MKTASSPIRYSPNSARFLARVLACTLASAAVLSHAKIDVDTIKTVAGAYSTDCANPGALRLLVTADALMIEQGAQRIVGRNAEAAYSFYGNSPPKDYSVALMGEARGGVQILFIVYSDKNGEYIKVEGDPKLRTAIGNAAFAAKHRHCDRQNAPVAAAPTQAMPTQPAPVINSSGAPDLQTLLADKKFRRAYARSIGPKASERWLIQMDGPAPATRWQTLENVPYVVLAFCKAHDCYDNSAVFLYSAEQDRVLGLIQQSNVKTLVGLPPPSIGAQLDRMWQAEFRK